MERRENGKGRGSEEDGQGKLDEEMVLVGKKERLGFARLGRKKRERMIGTAKRYR